MFLVWILSDLGSIEFHFLLRSEGVPEILEFLVDLAETSAKTVSRKVLDLDLRYKEMCTAYSLEEQDWVEADKVFDLGLVEEGIAEKAIDEAGRDVEELDMLDKAHSIVKGHCQ